MKKKEQKEQTVIFGPGRDPENKLIVQKSNPLLSLARSDFSLPELKIIDTYLARIDSHNPERRTVVFKKGELEQLLGVTQLRKKDLKERLRNLYQPVDLNEGNDKRIELVGLFEEATAEQDEDGVWQVRLTCTPKAMKYIFNVEQYGYLRYKLQGVIAIKSRYSFILYLYLLKNSFRVSWIEELDALKHELNCETDKSYAQFKVFNDRILKPCKKEIEEATECRFTYETIKNGRNVVAIRFNVEFLRLIPQTIKENTPKFLPEVPDNEDEGEEKEPRHPGFQARLEGLCEACNGDFSEAEMETLIPILGERYDPGSLDLFEESNYMMKMHALFKFAIAEKPVKNRLAYFRKMLENDIKKNNFRTEG